MRFIICFIGLFILLGCGGADTEQKDNIGGEPESIIIDTLYYEDILVRGPNEQIKTVITDKFGKLTDFVNRGDTVILTVNYNGQIHEFNKSHIIVLNPLGATKDIGRIGRNVFEVILDEESDEEMWGWEVCFYSEKFKFYKGYLNGNNEYIVTEIIDTIRTIRQFQTLE